MIRSGLRYGTKAVKCDSRASRLGGHLLLMCPGAVLRSTTAGVVTTLRSLRQVPLVHCGIKSIDDMQCAAFAASLAHIGHRRIREKLIRSMFGRLRDYRS